MPRLPSGRLASFRVQLALVIGFISIALSTALSGLFANVLATQIQRDKGLALSAIAQNLARSLEEGLRERSRQVELLAGSTELWRQGLGTASAAEALSRTRSSRAYAAWVGVADLQGRVRAAADGILQGVDVSERPWYRAGLKGSYVGDVHAAKLLAEVLPKSPSGEPPRFVDFAAPVVVDGRLLGVVGMHGSWEWATQLVRWALPVQANDEGIEVLIAGRDGEFLLAPEGAALEASRFARALEAGRPRGAEAEPSGMLSLAWEDGETYLTSALEVPEVQTRSPLSWKVVVRQPARVAYAQVRETFLLSFGAGLLLATLATSLAWVSSGYLSRPLVDIVEAAGRVERDEPGAGIPQVRSSRELAALSSALGSMTERMLQARQQLEQRVEERTNALRSANVQLQRISVEQHAMLDNELVGILKVLDGRIVWTNRAVARMLGYGANELLGLRAANLLPDDSAFAGIMADSREAMSSSGHFRRQVQMRRLDGELIWVDLSGSLLDPRTGEALWLLLDITALKQHQEQIEHIAFHDGLTGLANRLLLADRLQHAIAQSARSGRSFAVCHIDLDGFKAVNDQFGHEAGDRLLREVARRIGTCIRATDTAARFGGDEFVILLLPVNDAAECLPVVERLVDVIRRPVRLQDGREAGVSASIGIALYPEHGRDGTALIAQADAAMYRAKREGKNRYRFAELPPSTLS